jgi:hypothetical protein
MDILQFMPEKMTLIVSHRDEFVGNEWGDCLWD